MAMLTWKVSPFSTRVESNGETMQLGVQELRDPARGFCGANLLLEVLIRVVTGAVEHLLDGRCSRGFGACVDRLLRVGERIGEQ